MFFSTRTLLGLAVLLGQVAMAVPRTLAQNPLCSGDCNRDGTVQIDELITSVGIALGFGTLRRCPAADPSGDGLIPVAELVTAIGRATGGCPDGSSSLYGHWSEKAGLPAFIYDGEQDSIGEAEWSPLLAPPTRRHWVMLGNRAIQLQAANDGTVALFDEGWALRWLTAPDPSGTGISIVQEADGRVWGTDYSVRAGESAPTRTFGPTWFEVSDSLDDLSLERTILVPEGEIPWVLVRVRLRLADDAPQTRRIRHEERWALRPRFLNFLETDEQRRERAEAGVSFRIVESDSKLTATEVFVPPGTPGWFWLIGPPATLVLEALGDTSGSPVIIRTPHPRLELHTEIELRPGESRELWFRFGRPEPEPSGDPATIVSASLAQLEARLPRGASPNAPEAEREIPWHAALLTGGAARDVVLGGHTLDQGSTYSYYMGFNGAARDPLQHALPLVYSEPDLALSVLRNTLSWSTPEGDLPYAIDALKNPSNQLFRPSDLPLWALWLASEYAAATGDLAAFDEPLSFHPTYRAPDAPLREHLRRQFRFFIDFVGRGERNHVRILNADWNDGAIGDSGVDPDLMIEKGSSVLNSAMACWVLRVFSGLADRLGEEELAAEAQSVSSELRSLVEAAWNGRWFDRAYVPGGGVVGGENDCWLEVQPWALLCGAADDERARALLETIDRGHRAGSPLGARVRWPASPTRATSNGAWYSINQTLIWAAARVAPDMAWDEWRRMTLATHTRLYPGIWEGTLSGPDAWNPPESLRPGRTWGVLPLFAMQSYPVNNLHSHAAPILSYLRLLGVEPTERGTLAVRGGGSFESRTFSLQEDGHGSLAALGRVTVESPHGEAAGDADRVTW